MKEITTRLWLPLALAVLALGVAPQTSRADLDAGPCLQNITDSSVQLLYEGDVADGNGLVEYGLTPAYGLSVTANKREVNGEWYLADLTGLVPASQYYYRLTHAGIQKEGSFFTPPAPGDPFTFAVIGDTRSNHVAHQSVVDGVIAEGYPDLLFNSGDLVESGADKQLWQTFFAIEGDLLAHTILGPTMGNHDAALGSLFGKYFNSGELGKFWYSFSYGNAFFVALNTEALTTGEQRTFLENELIQARSNPDIDFVFVIFHKPGVTTSSGHTPDNGVLMNLMDLLETYNVDAVFNGHNHDYEHGIVNGVHHIVAGGGGAPLYGLIDPYTPQGWTIVARESTYQFCYLTVNGSSYTMEAKYPDGTVFDSYTATTADGGFAGPTPPDLLERSVSPCGGCASRYQGSVPDIDVSAAEAGMGAQPGTAALVFNAGLYGFPAFFIAGLRRKLRRK